MTPMKFVVKYFSEIATENKPVGRRFVAQNCRKLRETADLDASVYAP